MLGVVAALLVTIVIVVVTTIAQGSGSGPDGTNRPGVAGQSSKSGITHLTASMLLEKASFPNIGGGQWKSGVVAQRTVNSQFKPTECGALLGAVNATESGITMLVGIQGEKVIKGGTVMVAIYLPTEPLEVAAIQSNCAKIDDIPNPRAEWETQPIDLEGIPGWAGALVLNHTSIDVFGTYRGVFIKSNCDISRKDEAAKLFNEQVAKLEAV
jgi:hypothetical protein